MPRWPWRGRKVWKSKRARRRKPETAKTNLKPSFSWFLGGQGVRSDPESEGFEEKYRAVINGREPHVGADIVLRHASAFGVHEPRDRAWRQDGLAPLPSETKSSPQHSPAVRLRLFQRPSDFAKLSRFCGLTSIKPCRGASISAIRRKAIETTRGSTRASFPAALPFRDR